MSDTAPGPGTTSSRVRLPIDDVIDRVYAEMMDTIIWRREELLDLLFAQTLHVREGIRRKHIGERFAERGAT